MGKLQLRNRVKPKIFRYAESMRKNPTKAEAYLWQFLAGKRFGVPFYRQAILRGFIADFYCPKARLIVEVDGDGHNFMLDAARDAILGDLDIKTIRIPNRHVFEKTWFVLRKIAANVAARGGVKAAELVITCVNELERKRGPN